MSYVLRKRETQNGYIKLVGLNNEEFLVNDKEKATPFRTKSDIPRNLLHRCDILPLYISCNECKNCRMFKQYNKTGKQSRFLSCSKLVGVFPFNAKFIQFKHYDTPNCFVFHNKAV